MPSSHSQSDTYLLSESVRVVKILPYEPLPTAYVTIATDIEERDDNMQYVIGRYNEQSQYYVERMVKGEWYRLEEGDYTEKNYRELLPLVEAFRRNIISGQHGFLNMWLIPKYAHIPITGHRKAQAALMES